MMTLDEKVAALRPGMRVRATFCDTRPREWTVEGALYEGSAGWLLVGGSAVVVERGKHASYLTDIEVLPGPLPTEPGAVIEATVTRDGVSMDGVRLFVDTDGDWVSDRAIADRYRWHRPEHLSNVRVVLPGRAS